jgi:thiol peroxidase
MAGTVLFKGGEMHLLGGHPALGQAAPDVTLTKVDFSPLALSELRGRVVVLSVTPSLDTPVCDLQAQRFNAAAADLGGEVAVLNISLDLPPAVKRWCGATGSDQIIALSDYRERAFGLAYGVVIDELKLLARAVFVLDRDGVLRYAEIVPEVTQAPDYEAALKAAKGLV